MDIIKLKDEQVSDLLDSFLNDMSVIAVNEIEEPFANAGINLKEYQADDPRTKILISIYTNFLEEVAEPFEQYFGITEN